MKIRSSPLSLADRPLGGSFGNGAAPSPWTAAPVSAVTAFFEMLARTLPGGGQPPFAAMPWRPCVHLAMFAHRVRDLECGLYVLVRDARDEDALRASFRDSFVWKRPEELPGGTPLFLLAAGDYRRHAMSVSCTQEIASHGAFALGMIARYRETLEESGPWFYRRLHWEAGAVGQVLYLEAEAAKLRATGIGCFFDDAMHEQFGLADDRFQTIYHFTVGAPVEDPRLATMEAYAVR
ncbi:MAG: SagB/ThcOx family dehydrogenase [Deltaproteobacteria bacterium]|nr:SagB/ThcOx family dehydrogenase [Deltaproteobacteria bacterium]